MSDLKLLPCDHTPSANFVGLYLESTVFVAEKMGLLSKYAGQNSHDCPREKTSIGCCVAPVEKGVFLLGMAVNVAVDPYLALFIFCEVLEKLLHVVDFRVEFLLWIDPLSV